MHFLGELVPVNPSLPPILNLQTTARANVARSTAQVSLYAAARDGRVVFRCHQVPVNASDVNTLFVVRVLRWCETLQSYVGIAVDVIEPGNRNILLFLDDFCGSSLVCSGFGEVSASSLLSVECQVPPPLATVSNAQEIARELASIPETLPDDVISARLDFRENVTFTIEDDDQCRQMALSFDMLDEGCFLLGVHSADVTHYVKKGKAMDEAAAKRGA